MIRTTWVRSTQPISVDPVCKASHLTSYSYPTLIMQAPDTFATAGGTTSKAALAFLWTASRRGTSMTTSHGDWDTKRLLGLFRSSFKGSAGIAESILPGTASGSHDKRVIVSRNLTSTLATLWQRPCSMEAKSCTSQHGLSASAATSAGSDLTFSSSPGSWGQQDRQHVDDLPRAQTRPIPRQ